MSKSFEVCRIRLGAPLRAALQSLDESALGIVLVEDADGCVQGTLTDGDTRRALLAGATLDSPVDRYMMRGFASVGPGASRAEVLDIMQSRWLSQIPILDAGGRLIGLHTLHEILGAAPRPNWAVVMAGGRGERLRPITDTIPKPMIHVAGRPILERIVLHLVGFGIRRIFLAVNYKADIIERHFGDGTRFGCTIEYLREQFPLGTGGALSLLTAAPADPLLVLNGDLVTQFDVGSLLSFHERGRFLATVGIHEYAHTVPFGVVDVDEDRIVQMREKPKQVWMTNAGIYAIDPSLVARVPAGAEYPLPALIEECLDRQEPIGAFRIEADWIDVGRQAELKRARGLS
ncbi:MAG: CBS domain-containing protein [Alphaproteobacteria bacterium]|nr:CBS domain-containing protein [Alphaproteobacteria bacterium]